MSRNAYPSDLTDAAWAQLAPYVEQLPTSSGGRPRTVDTREMVNARLDLSKTGCPWRMLPHDFPAGHQVYSYFQQGLTVDTLTTSNPVLREAVRTAAGRTPEPRAAMLDSQSVKPTMSGDARGYDAAKQINGRKRHLIVATLGLVRLVRVTAAAVQHSDAGQSLLLDVAHRFRRIQRVCADQGYKAWLVDGGTQWVCWALDIVVKPPPQGGFQVHPKRWLVERSFGWFTNFRRRSKDYERNPLHSAAMIYLASIRLMLRKLPHSAS